MPWRARGPDGDRQAAASRPRPRSRRRSPPTRGGRSRPRRAVNRRDECPSARRRARSVRSGRCSPSPQPRDSGANQGALFASQVTARGPIVAPWNTPTVPIHQQPDPRKLRKCSEFLDSGEMGDPGLEPGTSSLSGKPFVASSRPNSHLIPANRGDGACGRGLERTGGDKLVAPSWPHGRGSRARRRMTRKRTSRRRYGQARTLRRRAAARLHDRVDRGEPRCVVELVHHVTRRYRGASRAAVTELARDIQPSACHAASTASLAFRPRRRRGCEETGAAADDLVASQPLRASREIRGERPT